MAPRVSALVVVDMQEDFCPPNGSLAVPSGRDVAARLNSLLSLPSFAIRVTTQDWHPANSKTFASAHSGLQPFTSSYTGANPANPAEAATWTVWPDHCVRDTAGAALIPELDTSKVDLFLQKGLDPDAEVYSGFGDVFGRRGGEVVSVDLAEALRAKRVTDVFVGGLAADYCVKATAMDAVRHGFATWVLWDCTRAISEEGGEEAREQLVRAGVSVVESDGVEVKQVLEGA